MQKTTEKTSVDSGMDQAAVVQVKCSYVFTRYKADNGFTVAIYRDQEKDCEFAAVGNALPTNQHLRYILNGTWVSNPKYQEHQLKVESYQEELPCGRNGITAYLSALGVGIGPVISERLYDKFGDALWTILEESPEKILSVKGITQGRMQRLIAKLQQTQIIRHVMELFVSAGGISFATASGIVQALGENAVEQIQCNPYILFHTQGLSFQLLDCVAKTLGISEDDPRRLEAGIIHLLNETASRGNVCCPKQELIQEMETKLGIGYDCCEQAIMDGVENRLLHITDEYVYTYQRYAQECGIAEETMRLLQADVKCYSDIMGSVHRYCETSGIQLGKSQKDAVCNVLEHSVCIITGGPGTGKTTTVRAILEVYADLEKDQEHILLLAPTGRAARRMSEATGYPAQTVHSATGFTGDESDWENGIEVLEASLIIVDECSMLDQYIAYRLLRSISTGTRLVLIGDTDQLPSVGCGNVLQDMLQSNVIPTTRLTDVYRQSAESPVIENAYRIHDGNPELKYAPQFQLVERNTAESILWDACRLYCKCVRKYGIDNVTLLCPYRNKGDICVDVFNQLLQERLNPLQNGQTTMNVKGIQFRSGDRVIQTKNTDAVMNGDIGYIREIKRIPDESEPKQWKSLAVIEFEDVILQYDIHQMRHVDLGYCTTVHKSQGSQYHTVIVVMSCQHRALLRRNLIYTAVTRATENCAFVGETAAIERAIQNDQMDHRITLLKSRLIEQGKCQQKQQTAKVEES